MAFLDQVRLNLKAGDGGSGVVRWRREKAIAMGGPAGGNGGKGGDIYAVRQRNMHTLHNYAHQKDFHAENGQDGGSKNMHGANGKDLYLYFPLGTVLYLSEYDKSIELIEEGQTEKLLHGGSGGQGNTEFKSSTNRSPEEFTVGKIGENATVEVDLKMIAQVGLIGYPNAGKSSLLNPITKAQSKVGNYNFTTLEPHLGDWYGYIIADIPGLIEGASSGKGLGIKFLKHVSRTNLLVHMIEATSSKMITDYKTIKSELKKYDPELLNKDEIVVISKSDNISSKDLKVKKEKLEKSIKQKVLTLSLYDDKSVKDFEKVLKAKLK